MLKFFVLCSALLFVVPQYAESTRAQWPEENASALGDYFGFFLPTVPQGARNWLLRLEVNSTLSPVIVFTFLCGLLTAVFLHCIRQRSKENAALRNRNACLEQRSHELEKELQVQRENSEQVAARHVRNVRDFDIEREALRESFRETTERLDREVQDLQSSKTRVESELARAEERLRGCQEAMEELRAARDRSEKKEEEENFFMIELRNKNGQLFQETLLLDERLRELTDKLTEIERQRDEANERCEVWSQEASLGALRALEKTRDAANNNEDEDTVVLSRRVLAALSAENKFLKEMNTTLRKDTMDLDTQLQQSKDELESSKNAARQALKRQKDAEQRLEVMSDYFADREANLQENIAKPEILRPPEGNDLQDILEQLQFYRDQNITIQAQLTAVKVELGASERNFKRQLMEQEKIAHENWMACKKSSKVVEDLEAELKVMRQQLNQCYKERAMAERMIPSPQSRLMSPPPLPLPRGVSPMSLPPMPLPNAMQPGLSSTPLERFIEEARRTPPPRVSLPSVIYQTDGRSSRHSSDYTGRPRSSRGGTRSPDLRRNSYSRRSYRNSSSSECDT